jgi:hypothetical protein
MTQQEDDHPPIPLETFAGVQDLEGRVDIVAGDDGRPQVIAAGRTASGLKVEWVAPGAATPAEQRVVQRFLASLSEAYGARITHAVAAELGLGQAGASLDTRQVKDALRMAETQKDVFSGANFFVELHCSAKARTPAFRAACAAAGLDADALAPAQLAEIEERFRRAAQEASQRDREPLSTVDGERVLGQVLTEWAAGRGAR